MDTGVIDNKYELVRLLGQGGMGSVHEARNLVTGKRVAVKQLLRAPGGDPTVIGRFIREARAATALEHPNVVDVYDVGVVDDHPYMVMELLHGEPLDAFLERRDHIEDPSELVELLLPAIVAVEHAHRKGIVHRDLKPENIFLCKVGDDELRPKIVDFGISKMETDDQKLTRTNSVMGTPAYMSPEQAAGRNDVDHQADVYAMGVILYEALTGHLPFHAQHFHALIVKIVTEPPTPVREIRPDLPVTIADVVMKALAKDRSERYQTMKDLGLALTSAVNSSAKWPTDTARGLTVLLRPDANSVAPTIAVTRAPDADEFEALVSPNVGGSAAAPRVESVPSSAGRDTQPNDASRPAGRSASMPILFAVGGTALTMTLAGLGWSMFSQGDAQGPDMVAPSTAVASSPTAPVPQTGAASGVEDPLRRARECMASRDYVCVVESLQGRDNSEAALGLIAEAAIASGDEQRATEAMRTYVRFYPDGVHAPAFNRSLAQDASSTADLETIEEGPDRQAGTDRTRSARRSGSRTAARSTTASTEMSAASPATTTPTTAAMSTPAPTPAPAPAPTPAPPRRSAGLSFDDL